MTIINEKNDFEKKLKNILKLYEIGSFEEVVSRTKPLIKKYPDIVDLYNLLALSYNGLNKTEEAIKLLDDIRPYYYVSKQLKYLDRELTYNNFTTILRQLCNIMEIKYTSTIKYDRSVYNIKYEIYYPTT